MHASDPRPNPRSKPSSPTSGRTSGKDTAISLVLAFAIAFVFRGFVLEAFVIPTGSMAPTLLGKNVRLHAPASGASWVAGPRDYTGHNREHSVPNPWQGSPDRPIVANDPMTGMPTSTESAPLRAGDRIFVQKYLYPLFEPARFDVVVFKYPGNPDENYIKRLIGLPGEQVALVDGDVFTRPVTEAHTNQVRAGTAFEQDGWTVARKPERIQRELWQPVFDSRHTPQDAGLAFLPPWTPGTEGWSGFREPGPYRYEGVEPTSLRWNTARWPVLDTYAYNEIDTGRPTQDPTDYQRRTGPVRVPTLRGLFPVSDLCMKASVTPDGPGASAAAVLRIRQHTVRAEFGPGHVRLTMTNDATQTPLVRAEAVVSTVLEPERASVLELWHVDQALWVFVDEELVLREEYDWSVPDRLEHALSKPLSEVLEHGFTNPFALREHYREAEPSWEFAGSPLTVHRVLLQRDIHYQALVTPPPTRVAGRGTHPRTVPSLEDDQYFVCGDNSPFSADSRYWDQVHPWAATIDPEPGLVNRRLLIGKAFFVYWPARLDLFNRKAMVNFGEVRWIW